MIRPTLPTALLLATALLQTAHAAQPLPPPDLGSLVLPDIDRETLVADLETLRSTLIRRKQELAQQVRDRKLDGRDAVITAIVPGGLLYAGIKKARYAQAQDALAAVSADIAELSGDLQALQRLSTPVAVVDLP